MTVRKQALLYLALVIACFGSAFLVMWWAGDEPARPPHAPSLPPVASAAPAAADPPPPSEPRRDDANDQAHPVASPNRHTLAPRPVPPARAALRGRVQDAAGNAIAGASLDLRAAEGATLARGASDADGRFVLDVGAAAQGSLLARHPEHAGALVHGVRAGTAEVTVVLEPGFAVHGLVCERGTKAPVPGALVGIIPNDAPPEHTQTDARGEYRFAHLRGGSALLVVNALGWEEVRRRFDISGALDVEMTPGASYQGRVIDGGTQAPIAGAALTWKWIGASWLAGIWFLEAPPLPEITITTDPWGCFAFERIGLQTGAVHVVARGYQPYVSSEFEPQIKLFGPLTLCGVVVDPGGGPVAQANVELLGRGASARTDARGQFEIANVVPYGRLELAARHPDWAPARSGALALPLAEPMIRLELALPARIAGMVRDADSRPAALVSVALHAIDSDALPAPRDGDRFVAASRSTDGDGRFQFDGLPAGKYLLYTQTEMGARGEVQVAAGETASITLELRRSAALQGRCLDEQDRPVASALITCLVDSSMRIAESDEHGGFALKDIPEQASVVLQAEHEGFVPSQVKAKAGDQDVLVRMGHGLTLRGVVRSRASGAPIAGAAIALETASRQQFLRAPADVSALSGDDGSFQLGPLGLGELGIVVRAAAHAPLETSLAMRSNSEPIELWLDPAILWGRVQHRSGAPAAQVAVFLLDEQGQVRGGPVTTADDGHFAFAQAEPGRGLICIGDPARPLVPPEPVSIDATTTSLARHCTLPDAATLAISLRDRTGRPVREGRVTLDYQGRGASTHGQAEVDDAGLALLAGLYPGHYRVAVESPHFALLQTTLEVADWSTCEQTLTLSHGGE